MLIPFFTLERQNNEIKGMLANTFDEVISKGDFILGGQVRAFEESFAKFLGADHCVSCGNGTDALELILEGLEIKSGDEVIIPDNTWVSLAEAVKRVGGVPVCCDVLKSTFNLSPESVKSTITDRTFAIIVVHQYGNPADMDALMKIKQENDLYLIEDCAHAAGAEIEGKKCGAIAEASSFSFYPTKNLGAFGDGGAVVTNNDSLAERITLLRNHGQVARDKHVLSGRNSRLDELQAAFLLTKLTLLESVNQKRRTIAMKYYQFLQDVDGIKLPEISAGHIFHQFVIICNRRDELMKFLSEQGIGTAIHYPHTISSMGIIGFNEKEIPISAALSKQVLSLPVFPELTMEEVSYISNSIKQFFA